MNPREQPVSYGVFTQHRGKRIFIAQFRRREMAEVYCERQRLPTWIVARYGVTVS